MKRWLVGVGIFLVLLTVFLAAYTVSETEVVVITQFGDPIGEPITDAGLHFKVPFVQKANRFEKRILEWDGERNQIPTADKRYIWVDTTARWRIANALQFIEAVRTENGAQARLDDILDSATRNQISRYPLVEVARLSNRILDLPIEGDEQMSAGAEYMSRIEVGREEIAKKILEEASLLAPNLGIELVDVRIKRINYVETVRRSVYERMVSERNRIAERFRSEGQGLRAEILGEKDRDEKTIASEGYRKAQEIIAKADAEAAVIYAEAFEKNAEFYSFVRTLEVYRTSVGQNHTLVVAPDSDFYRFFLTAEGPPPAK